MKNERDDLERILDRVFGDGFLRVYPSRPQHISRSNSFRDADEEELYDEILNRDKYKDGASQQEAFRKYCEENKQNESVDGFVKWLDAKWKSPEVNEFGISEGDYAYVRNSPVIRVVRKLKFSKSGELWAEVDTADYNESFYHEIVPASTLVKATRKPWTREQCIDRLGVVIESAKDGTVEKITRVRTGKDGKVYVNGTSVDELASSWTVYGTKEPCCFFGRPEENK